MKKQEPAARPKAKRSLRPLGPQVRAGTSPPAVTATVQSKTEFQQIVHELQVHQEELEAQNEELRETQQLLEASRDRYADLYDFAPIGYTTFDEKGHIREINLTGATILGRERSRLLGTLFSVAVAKDDLSAFHSHLRQCQQGSGPVTTELTLTVHGREPIPVQLYSVPIPDLIGQTTMYRTAITDITVRKQAEKIMRVAHDELEDRVRERTKELAGAVANLRKEVSERERVEEELRESERRFSDMLRNLELVSMMLDREARITYCNDYLLRLTGWRREEVMGRDWLEIFLPPEIVDELRGIRLALLADQPVAWHHENEIVTRSGARRLIRWNNSVLLSASGEAIGTASIGEDITERKQAEEALRRLSVSLLQTQDEERRRIARELHDSTGQKLAALAMNLSLIGKSEEKLNARAQEALAESLALLDQSSREIRTLSYLLHPPLLDERGLTAAVRWFVDGFSQRSGVQVKLEVPPDLQRLPEEIEMALFRIVQEGLTNAHRHSGSSTAVIRLMVDQNHVRLEVQDAGKGLSRSRADGHMEALGVGITGMRERVKLLGGQMEMESGSHGTTVRVTVPLDEAAS
jgi:PAS domain S-box-containing protein